MMGDRHRDPSSVLLRPGARLAGNGWHQRPVRAIVAAAARPRALVRASALAGFADVLARQIRAWAAVEVGPGRLFPWLPVAFGAGIVLYFTADREPLGWAAAGLAAGGMAAVFAARRHALAFALLLGVAAAALGF